MDDGQRRPNSLRFFQKTNSSVSLLPVEGQDSIPDLELQVLSHEGSGSGVDSATTSKDYLLHEDNYYDEDDRAWHRLRHPRQGWAKCILWCLLGFLLFPMQNFITQRVGSYVHGEYRSAGGDRSRAFTIENVLAGDFMLGYELFEFIAPPRCSPVSDEGFYVTLLAENDVPTFSAKKLTDDQYTKALASTSFNYGGQDYRVQKIVPSFSLDFAILSSNRKPVFRHSSQANYWLRDVGANTIEPITPGGAGSPAALISYAKFSPCYRYLYFVAENDLYIRQLRGDGALHRITFDGTAGIHNGKTDWVYEEEVMGSDNAVWWKDDDSAFVYLRINSTGVRSYAIPRYIEDDSLIPKQINYPAPGSKLPSASLILYNIADASKHEIQLDAAADYLIYDAVWLSDTHFMFKVADRESRNVDIRVFNVVDKSVRTVRSVNSNIYDGWIEKMKPVLIIPADKDKGRETGYVDICVDSDGYPHLFYFPDIYAANGRQLTSGPWEITSDSMSFDAEKEVIYFHANKRHPMAQHIYSVALSDTGVEDSLPMPGPANNTDYYEFTFSASSKFSIMKYLGPDLPSTRVGPTALTLGGSTEENSEARIISHNDHILETVAKHDLPQTSYLSAFTTDDAEIHYVEIKPRHMNPKKKYPLLVSVYGGPGSRTFNTKFDVMLDQCISSGLDAIVLQIEPRGTGGKGWNFRSWARQNIGHWEPRDITAVTRKYISQHAKNVDTEHVAIWGWSYGGFTTLKTLEYDQGQTFKYGISVAPVTDWRLYDAVYTERYMGTPKPTNDAYGEYALIKNIDAFSKVKRFLLLHGTADDNVHIENTYKLLDSFNVHNVRNYDSHIFPDSNHALTFHNAGPILYRQIYHWLENAFSGKFDALSS
ncbi:ACR103Cp [Eremothecium gossypii ATCC 10895]|uniref:ACR103Cp n=1 Tax=Eremothecium gossypii (strain ATCC 10895 / CBS 109.51 / FGSC 9923 / NRRL Y-1056) TaxID=284811 RepID=Q75C14_EREGS|nr:ACR103Cp [Eremothecium gossypii ATCC 10895]AAS51329.2 ACR103Cp [Eremothecium gossypii ATCC 10895]AEY95621.1 FACR103Cp [Eremothecium gossypii FDAG1]